MADLSVPSPALVLNPITGLIGAIFARIAGRFPPP
jgi:hypothetical protein